MRHFIDILENQDYAEEWQEAVESKDWDDAFLYASTPEEVSQTLQAADAKPVKINNETFYIIESDDPFVVEWNGKDAHGQIESFDTWIYEVDLEKFFPGYQDKFNTRFWQCPYPLYHATKKDRVDKIRTKGLERRDETRGLSNKNIGYAVFTTRNLDEAETGDYGSYIFQINTVQMKKDGFCPYVSKEPPIVDAELRNAIARAAGIEDCVEHETGLSTDTVIIYEDIAPRYLILLD